MKQIELVNNTVLLRPISVKDIDELAEVAIDERIWEHIAFSLKTKDDVERYVHDQLELTAKGERYVYVIIDQITKKIIGVTSIYDISEHHAHGEIGSTWLTPKYWRTAINTNCKYLLLHYLFEILQFERVQLKTDNLNERSQQAIQRIGAKFEGRLRSHMRRKDGSMRDTMLYSIVRDEWPEVKLMLENRLIEVEDR